MKLQIKTLFKNIDEQLSQYFFCTLQQLMQKFTPAMQQYIDIKQQYQDCILFFRLGDFYEVFFEDAKLCHQLLDIVLTSKNKNADNPIPMAGIPHHSSEKYITKLVHLGYKVAIAEQTTLPKPGQIVEREVKQVITPGTYFEETDKQHTYIFAITSQLLSGNSHYHCAWGDFSLGEYHTASFQTIDEIQKKLLTLSPSEIVLDIDFNEKDKIHTVVQTYLKCLVSVYDVPHNPIQWLKSICHFANITSFGKALMDGRETAFGLLLHYLYDTQQLKNINITQLKFHNEKDFVLIDETTIKNLEIFKSSYESNEKYSLFGVINNTATSSGSRLLQDRLLHPLKNIKNIKKRLFFINHRYEHNLQAEKLHYILKQTSDIIKIVSSIFYKKPLPILFSKLRKTLDILCNNGEIMEALSFGAKGGGTTSVVEESFKRDYKKDSSIPLSLHSEGQPEFYNDGKHISQIFYFLQSAFVDDENINNETGFVRPGFDTDIDKLTNIAFHSDDLLLQYQQELVSKTGVTNIKLKFIKNQGYFLELTNKDIGLFEEHIADDEKFDFQRRQTLKGNQRYVTTYLENIQGQILQAREELTKKEQDILIQSVSFLEEKFEEISKFANMVAKLDVYTSQALLSKAKNYTKPRFTNNSLNIVAGRHPVIEKFLPIDQQFVSNDLNMTEKGKKNSRDGLIDRPLGEIQIITGPNMGGKSTFLRQNALIVLMAHCGLFCPAKIVELPLIDGIFARVGSGDVIAKNQSTFMTEMIEVSNILHNATDKSFVIFDELGRGTSTYDGLALTQAILEHIANSLHCKTLVATHYHELISLENHYENIKNYSVSVYETDKDVVFLKKIVAGGADKSYGIDVAKLAGIPKQILDSARSILGGLQEEQEKNNVIHAKAGNQTKDSLFIPQRISSDDKNYEKVISMLKSYNLNSITPIQAMNLLVKLQDEV